MYRDQAPVIQTLDSTVHHINHCPADKYYGNQLHYLLDSDLPMDSFIQLLNYWGQFGEIVSGHWGFKGVPSLLLQLSNLGT